jgi:very-short-patch-repair endonuclease
MATNTSVIPSTFLSRSSLLAGGFSRRQLRWHVAEGRLIRARKGRYLPGDTHPGVVRAVSLGGRIDCVSLLHLLGVHVLEHRALHVQITNGASRLPEPGADVVRHWRVTDAHLTAVAAPLVEALVQACRCQSPRDAIATLDSALHLGLVDYRDIAEVFARLPQRFGILRQLIDARAESGPETIMRLLLRSLGRHVEVQVQLDGVGRVDLIVDGWLIVECDSRAFHEGWEAQKRDRHRDIAAAGLGYTTIRPMAEDILYRRDEVLAALKDILRVHELSKTASKSRRAGS